MKYNQPFGISDPNAAYINGNPATGTMGSIPPAASIEYPQREIASFIADNAITPSNADLRQLSKSVQAGIVNYSADAGTANAIQLTLTPPLTAYFPGLAVRTKIKVSNTGPSTLSINGLTPQPIIHPGGGPMAGLEMLINEMVLFIYDGTSFQKIGANLSVYPILTAPRDYYVNTATGLDTNDGLTAGTAFKTIQHACDVMTSLNTNGYNVTIHVADGTYGPVDLRKVNGGGMCKIIGNSAAPGNCLITGVTSSPGGGLFYPSGAVTTSNAAGAFWLEGLAINCPSTNGIVAYGDGSVIRLVNMQLNTCGGAQILATAGGAIFFPSTVDSVSSVIRVNGSAQIFLAAHEFGLVDNHQPPLTIMAAVSYSMAFVSSMSLSYCHSLFGTITGASSVTGVKYQSSMNSVIDVGGSGINYLPGTAAGYVVNGSTYA